MQGQEGEWIFGEAKGVSIRAVPAGGTVVCVCVCVCVCIRERETERERDQER